MIEGRARSRRATSAASSDRLPTPGRTDCSVLLFRQPRAPTASRSPRSSSGTDAVLAGSPRFLPENGVEFGRLSSRRDGLESAGHTVIALARDAHLRGLLALRDEVRGEAAPTVAAPEEAGLGTVPSTGDASSRGRRRRTCRRASAPSSSCARPARSAPAASPATGRSARPCSRSPRWSRCDVSRALATFPGSKTISERSKSRRRSRMPVR